MVRRHAAFGKTRDARMGVLITDERPKTPFPTLFEGRLFPLN
jgi:hypothetical protein